MRSGRSMLENTICSMTSPDWSQSWVLSGMDVFFVDPQPVAVAVFVARMQRDHARGAAEQPLAFAAADFVDQRVAIVDGRQRAEQRTVGSAALDQHGALVGEITGELVAFANELAARAVERQQPLGDIASAHAVDDAQRFDAAAVHVREHADVVARGERVVHALEPFFRLGAQGDARAQQQRERREARPCAVARSTGWRESRRIGGSCDALARWSSIDQRTGDIGRIGGYQAEQRHAARQGTGIFAVRDHVVREPRRRRDAGGRTRRRRDVAIGLAIRTARVAPAAVLQRHGGADGFGRQHDGFGGRRGWLASSGSADLPGCAARRWTWRRRRRQCWRRRPGARNASSARRHAA